MIFNGECEAADTFVARCANVEFIMVVSVNNGYTAFGDLKTVDMICFTTTMRFETCARAVC